MSHDEVRIQATTQHVDELVDRALRGRVRVPTFQRGLKWTGTHVRELFDSLYRGYPIGTLLMWKRPAAAGEVRFGPLAVDVDGFEDAWWVVDGQQRLTSMVAGLRHPDLAHPHDPFVVYADLEGADDPERPFFFRPTRQRPPGPLDLPLASAFDPGALQEWIFAAVQRTQRRDIIQRASELASRIRNYRVPVYVVETDDPDAARQIFLRTNLAGRRMEMHEVFAALAPAATPHHVEPAAIAARLAMAYGEVDPNLIVKAARALLGDDVTHGRSDAAAGTPERSAWMARTEIALRRALDFLVSVGVPHLRLLPARLTPVVVLARFFDRHPTPHPRTLRLLRRWLWRGFLGEDIASNAKTFRAAVVSVTHDEHASVQQLLAQVQARPSADLRLPDTFDARHGPTRLAMLVLALSDPARVPILTAPERFSPPEASQGVFDWLQQHEAKGFTRLHGTSGIPNRPELRFLTAGATPRALRDALTAWARTDVEHPALASHLVPPEAARALLDGRLPDFVHARRARFEARLREVYEAYAEPLHDDRGPLVLPEPSR